VSGWKFIDRADTLGFRDFFIGQYEVTNAEYKAFVSAGGYQQQRYWDPLVIAGDTVPWAKAMARYVDRTGRPGPSIWEAGDYPSGEADFPVSGVSWYEAAAFARFARRELPTAHHWQQALANSMFPWMLPASNFSGKGARAVTASRAFSHVGAFDLAGNAREWTATAMADDRIILGGSWNDPYYIAGLTDSSAPPEDRSPGNGFRLALTFDDSIAAARVRAPMAMRSTTASPVIEQVPVSDDVYAAYSRVFDYDRGPLDATVESIDTTRVWIRERVRFAAGYGNERMLLYLYLPARGRPPYQTVVYWPGWDTFSLDDVDEYFAKQVDFILKSGRAVAFPIYRGIFERRVGDERRRPNFGTAEYRDNTIYTVKDLRRTIDYLETRSDINTSAIAFFGYSWGGVNGPVALAQEPRLRVAVIQIGLLPPMAATPEADPVNALPRVRVPTLMFSGEFDAMVPAENSNRYFSLIGTSAAQKRHVIAIGGHFIPRALVIRESLDWLDKYLGPVSRSGRNQ
jgi:eukaryotic-like serine/threonine-protein kinase